MAKSTVAVRFTGDGAGLQGALGELDSKLGGFGQKAVEKIGPAGLALAGVASAAAGVGVALFKIGGDFQEQFNKITVGTGATGKALQGLDNDFKNVLKSGPDSMDQVGTAITTLNQKLGLTGKPLEDLSTKFLDLSRITKTDLATNIAGATGIFNQFGIAAKDQGANLDLLFRASQSSGVAVGDLESQISGAGPVFKALGFSVGQAATVVAGLGKEGLSTADVMPALSKVMGVAAKEGKNAGDVYRDLIASIKNAPSDTAAAKIAFDELGAKAGKNFTELVRSGKYSFDQLGESIFDGSGTIEKSAKKVETFGEKWDTIKNRVLVGLEPVATAVFNGMGTAMDKLGPIIDNDIVPAFEKLGDWWQQNGPGIEAFVSQVFNTISSVIHAFVAIVTAIWNTFGSTILTYIKSVFESIKSVIQGAMDIVQGIIKTVTALIHGDWGQAWDGIKQIFSGVWEAIKGIVQGVMAQIHALISAGWTVIKGVFTAALGAIKDAVSTGFKDITKFFKDLPGDLLKALGDVSKLLEKAGLAIIKSLLNGLKQGFEDVKHFVGGVAHTIASLKGPLEYDAVLLNPHGEAIMQSLFDGLQAKYGPLLDFVRGIAGDISGSVAGGSFSVSGGGVSASLGSSSLGLAGGAVVVNVVVQGSVQTEANLVDAIRRGLALVGTRNA